MKSVIIIIDYFGQWPEWFPIFLESCKWNPTVKWLFHTDCPCDITASDNVVMTHITRTEYSENVLRKLGIRFCPADDYKLCDLRPTYGILYEEEIRGFDFFGYGDIDVIYGDIRSFYTDQVLERNNVVSTHGWCLSGHFGLIRNVDWLRNAFRRVQDWKAILEDSKNRRFDEDAFSRVFAYPTWCPRVLWPLYDRLDRAGRRYRQNLYCREQYTTPLTPSAWLDGTLQHPDVWYWKNGRITNSKDGDREFIYLHFMNYKNARFMNSTYGRKAYWDGVKPLVKVKYEDICKGISIDRHGFRLIDDEAAV